MWDLLLLLGILQAPLGEGATYARKNLAENRVLKCCDRPRKDLIIYCFEGRYKSILRLMETTQLQISLAPEEYSYYMAHSPEDVVAKYESDVSSWAVNLLSIRRKSIKLNPFNATCVGISTMEDYDIKLNLTRVDYWRILQLVLGLLLFLLAPKLASNSIFYYLTGISIGTLASMLILVYILGRFVPKKPFMYSFLAAGWTVGLYMVQLVWENVRTIFVNYKIYVLYYGLATGIISFCICYRMGPVTDPRSIDLIKWLLQVIALGMIFCSTEIQEAGMAMVVVLLISYLLPFGKLLRPIKSLKRWLKPEVPKLLTEEEYYHQGAEETRKALDDLRGYCSSPECNQWKTVLRLKEPISSPFLQRLVAIGGVKEFQVRFAKFVQGASHISDNEVLAFETEGGKPDASDDILTDVSSDED